ncbi:hypothetical protein CBM2633_P300008 [Cupriavidus taiwanensis]|uniref:Uncharacterized protein n=2 Tax=Cupriavidus TaxID=106589 RepID=A0A9Q7XU65_9BURK|nr:hypothetical protein CBM2598_P230008 [Cupriavidus taiwanensis]SPA23393.1 hypothetical protein CBM2633_P300008 [Cupriavidus taiwanensis]SPD37439.1 protein of unknown function [Cupriavidus taiwanensis]SPD62499.1 protein of unknown function [Cupriavidus neocaledonicus]SPD69618.1 protein of unknown function [Cupriavidus taiwanensis]
MFSSYGTLLPSDEVFVQPMAKDIAVSGVVMTCDPESGLPYGRGSRDAWTLGRRSAVGSANSQIATLVERQTKFVMLVKIASKDSEAVVNALIKHAGKLQQELLQNR